MDLHGPNATLSSSDDPFELERLADELEARGWAHGHSIDTGAHELPLYTPLTHGDPFLTATQFNVEEFLLSRSRTSLPELRTELRDYLATLKEELVQLINDDYEAFISLSTDLRGEGTRLERLKLPLGDLKSQILESRQRLSLVQDAVQGKLKKRSDLRDEKTYLHLLLKVSESVTRLESLLLIASPDEPSSSELRTLPLKSLGRQSEDSDDRPRGNRAKHLVRVAAEYTHLLYHVTKAQTVTRTAFVDEIQWRISRIQSTLSSDLDRLFSDTAIALSTGKLPEDDKAKRMADLTECLRTYDALQLWRDAEDVFRRDVLREFVKKTIFPGALHASHTLSLPQTPFPIHENASTPGTMRTPYEPFTAFASRTNPFDAALAAAPRLDETDNPLAVLYNGILSFVERDVKRIMDIAERISARIGQQADGVDDGASAKGFEIFANVVWAELARALMDELGSTLFAAGRPDEFRRNYETTQAFIRSLQYLAPSVRAIRVMVTHPTFLSFERRWQLPVYFQLRWKDIVTRLEDTLSVSKLEPESTLKKAEITPFVMSSTAAVWSAMATCWDRNVFVPQLAHRFWKLMLQILSRYRTWIENSLPAYLSGLPKSLPSAETTKSISRASTPATPGQAEGNPSESTSADDALLRQCAAVIADAKLLQSQTWVLWRDEVSPMLAPVFVGEESPTELGQAEDALRSILQGLSAFIPPLSSQIISILTRRASDALQPVRSMPLQFRAMSNKRPPSEPSFFVVGVLRPVRAFFGMESGTGPGAPLKAELMQSFAEEVFEAVVQKYIIYVTTMRKKEESLRKLKKGKKAPFSLFGGGPKEEDGRDEERIRQQMALDVEAFGKDAETLGVDVQGSVSFKSLLEIAIAPLNDDASASTPTPT
ncbi:COG complex component [Lactarius hatsudake]|nr:COG complex component [Lactarius hatsudake]